MYADITSTPLEFYRSPQTSDLGSLSRRSEQDSLTRMSRTNPYSLRRSFPIIALLSHNAAGQQKGRLGHLLYQGWQPGQQLAVLDAGCCLAAAD